MLHLMKLELRKIKAVRFMKGFLISDLILLAFMGLSLGVMTTDSEAINDFSDFSQYLLFLNVMVRSVFIIYSSVILNQLTINEYKERTVLLMFTYPVNRKKLFVAKLTMVFVYTILAVVLSTVIVNGLAMILASAFNLFPDLTIINYLDSIQYGLISAVSCGFASLVPFYFGMRKKQPSATMITSVIIAVIMAQSGGMISQQIDMLRLLIVGGISILFVALTLHVKLNQLEESDV